MPVREFAREPRQPPSLDDARRGRLSSYARWEIGKSVYAWMVLLAYLEYAQADDTALQTDVLEPRRADESEQEFEARRRSAELLVETSAMAGSPAAQVTEILSSWVAQSIVPELVENLAHEGVAPLDKNDVTPDPAEWQAGARMLLGGVCPSRHWDTALDHLELLAHSRLVITGEIRARMTEHPAATIHATAALVAWIYGQPHIVPSEAEATLELAERASKFGEQVF